MPIIPTIRLLFVIWTNAPFLLQIIEIYYNFIFAGRKISRNSIPSGYYFRGRKISRKIQIREYSENFLHAKNWCYTVCERKCHHNNGVETRQRQTGDTLDVALPHDRFQTSVMRTTTPTSYLAGVDVTLLSVAYSGSNDAIQHVLSRLHNTTPLTHTHMHCRLRTCKRHRA